VNGDDRRLREEIRAVADRFEAAAEAEGQVAARIDARLHRTHFPAALLGAMALIVIVAIGLRGTLPAPDTGAHEMPTLVGIFRSLEPDAVGRCVAVRLYDTTSTDGRVALWVWSGANGCAARRSNLTTGPGSAEAVALPAAGGSPERSGIRIEGAPSVAELLASLMLVLDPAGPQGTADLVPGYWSLDEGAGPATIQLERVDELTVPYRPD
jgi:hypothetical protein